MRCLTTAWMHMPTHQKPPQALGRGVPYDSTIPRLSISKSKGKGRGARFHGALPFRDSMLQDGARQ